MPMSTNVSAPEAQDSCARGTRSVPVRALLLSDAALVIALMLPRTAAGSAMTQPMVWLAALIPPFLLSWYRGWVGAALAFAIGMAALSLSNGAVSMARGTMPDDPLFMYLGSAFILVTLAAGWVTEMLHRTRRDALRGAGDLVLTVSCRGVITFASESCGRVFGTTAESLVGQRVEDLVHPLDAPAARALLSSDTEAGLASRRELRVPGERGERTIELLREERIGPRSTR